MRAIFIKFFIASIMLTDLNTVSFAMLAPHYQRANEMNAVIAAATEKLQPEPITKIIYQNEDQYLITTGNCTLKASIITIPMKSGMVGPRQFKVQLSKQQCKK